MKNLKDFQASELKTNSLFNVNGGGATRYTRGSSSGTDTYTDDNGSGGLDSGDTVYLDTGEMVCP
ncbi:MAG: hypothetical protein L3J08_08705 [Flavobacteriaceae bacterium]|nr:hypothetical protein [Flavobacteriaceae bacterium]